MKLPIPFFKKKKEEGKYYLALLLSGRKVEGAVLEEEDGKVKIVGTHKEKLTAKIEEATQEETINIIDKVISRAEESLPPNIETHKTVFGVKESWIEKDTKKIKKEYLAKLKKLCDKLDLEPIGFMVINEAIANMLQSDEEGPLSAILADLGKTSVTLFLFRGGKVAEQVDGHVTGSVPAAIDTLLKKFTAPVLPSKLVIAHADNIEKMTAELNEHSWSKSLPFLHIPQVKILPENFYIKSVVFGAATQLGFNVIGLHAFSGVQNTAPADDEIDDKTDSNNDDRKSISEALGENQDNFGFLIDEDIAEKPQTEKEPEVHDLTLNQDVDEETNLQIPEENADMNSGPSFADEPKNDDGHTHQQDNQKGILSKIKSFIPPVAIPDISMLRNLLNGSKKIKIIGLAVIGGIIILTALGFAYFQNSKAEIILSVKPNEVSIDEQLTFSTSASSDFSENIIAAKTVTAEIEGTVSSETTGEKDIGEKASGTVTIFNNDKTRVSLSSGTEIKSSNGLTFTLTENVNVASASGDIFSGTTPGKADAEVEAREIGDEGNLSSGTTFSVGGNSALAAKNDDAFSGGSRETVRVVSNDDLSNLRDDLLKKLEGEAVKSLSGKAESGEVVIPVVLETEFDSENFDKEAGDEAENVSLSATIIFTGVAYDQKQLDDFAKSMLKNEHSKDIVFADKSLKIDLQEAEIDDDENISALAKIKADLLPEIDTDEIVKKINDKSPKAARAMLNALPQVESTRIKYSPNIFFLSGLLPRLPKNLNVTIATE